MSTPRWYQLTAEAVIEQLHTSAEGLTAGESAMRLEKYGPNRLPEEKGTHPVVILLRQFASPLIYILIVAAVVTLFLEEYKDTIVIAAVLLLNAVIGFIQEYKAEESVMALEENGRSPGQSHPGWT